MVKIIIVSHGNYGQEIIKSAEMICGKINNISSISLQIMDTIDTLREKIDKEINKSNFNKYLILVDFLGGTPYNAMETFITNKNICVISGFNLPMILKLASLSNESLETICKEAEKSGKEGIINITQIFNEKLCKYNCKENFNEKGI